MIFVLDVGNTNTVLGGLRSGQTKVSVAYANR